MPSVDQTAGAVRVERDGPLVTLVLRGRLDGHAGVELLAALQDEIEAAPDRVDIDLCGVGEWTPEGARALRRARRLARVLDGGLHYRCAAGAGHDALLEAFAEVDEADGDGGDAPESAAGDDTVVGPADRPPHPAP